MKNRHLVCIALALFALFVGLHYFTHHKGQNPLSAYVPGA